LMYLLGNDDGSYYDGLIRTIDAMAEVHGDSLVQLYKGQRKQIIRDFTHVRNMLRDRKDLKTDDNFSSVLKELYWLKCFKLVLCWRAAAAKWNSNRTIGYS
jgi:hypothetical protein